MFLVRALVLVVMVGSPFLYIRQGHLVVGVVVRGERVVVVLHVAPFALVGNENWY
ncbi:hypothetical protein ACFLXD_03825 [Chloroflexota bacterium]